MDVRDFLELQGAFERDRVVDAAAQEEEIRAVVEPLGHFLHRGRGLERLLQNLRHLQQLADVIANLRRGQGAAHLRHVKGQELQRDQLRGERLGRGNANLGAGVRIDRALGLAGRHAADHVADGDAVGALALRLAQRGERVGGFA